MEGMAFADSVTPQQKLSLNIPLHNTRSKSDMENAKEEIVSFLQSTIKSMEQNRNSVVESNKALDEEVKSSQSKLDEITKSFNVDDSIFRRSMGLPPKPFSLLQTKSYTDFDESPDDQLDIGSDQIIFRKSVKPVSIIEMAKARAADSEKRFKAAMKRLEADKQKLLKDETMRRARAAEERRHLHLQG
jgi:hypothetical protein